MGGMVGEVEELCNYLLSRFAGKIVSDDETGWLPYVKREHRHIGLFRRGKTHATKIT
jgi:hypothetical protein